jgi:hypothetical protein
MSEQMDLFNSNGSLSLLAELTLPRPERNLRKTELLRDPGAVSENADWAFIVPTCFNDALDIKKTIRIKNKKKHEIWTQGSTFFFKTGDIFYNKRDAYTDWPKAISDGLYAIQVISGKSSVPGKNGKNQKDRDKGEVTYTVYHGCKKDNVLKKEGVHTTKQDDFIKILISGLESVPS